MKKKDVIWQKFFFRSMSLNLKLRVGALYAQQSTAMLGSQPMRSSGIEAKVRDGPGGGSRVDSSHYRRIGSEEGERQGGGGGSRNGASRGEREDKVQVEAGVDVGGLE